MWWNTVKITNITTFLLNEMLALDNAWFYTVMAVRLKSVVFGVSVTT